MTEQPSEERRKFENALNDINGKLSASLPTTRLVQAAWEGWQARAELAVPAPDLICSRCDAPMVKLPVPAEAPLEDIAKKEPERNLEYDYDGDFPTAIPAVAPAQTPEEVAQDAARRLLAGVKSVIADPAQTLAYFNSREDLLAGRRGKETK